MSGENIYDTAAFALPGGHYVLAALKGSTNSYVRGALTRRWQSLSCGTLATITERTCELAADVEGGNTEYKPKPGILAEDLLAAVQRKIKKAAPLGEAFASANMPRVAGFCVQVERDAIAQWQAESPAEAAGFLASASKLRAPYGVLLLERSFPATAAGLIDWRGASSTARYVRAFAVIHGRGEI